MSVDPNGYPWDDDMKPWHGGDDGPPVDWRRGWKVLHRNGRVGSVNSESASYWRWDPDDPELDIIAYPAEIQRLRKEGE